MTNVAMFLSSYLPQGEARKTLTLRTRPDNILEGEERFTLSLVAADNNADISPINSDATIIILADEGASGVISIRPESRFVVLAEPSEGYAGRAEVHLARSGGVFGEVKVTWQIVRRDLTAFVQTQGEVSFEDGQPTTAILIQVGYDNNNKLYLDTLNIMHKVAVVKNI